MHFYMKKYISLFTSMLSIFLQICDFFLFYYRYLYVILKNNFLIDGQLCKLLKYWIYQKKFKICIKYISKGPSGMIHLDEAWEENYKKKYLKNGSVPTNLGLCLMIEQIICRFHPWVRTFVRHYSRAWYECVQWA